MRDVWTADMVNEPELPLFRVDFDWLFSFFAPRYKTCDLPLSLCY